MKHWKTAFVLSHSKSHRTFHKKKYTKSKYKQGTVGTLSAVLIFYRKTEIQESFIETLPTHFFIHKQV